jgi:peptide/nickel transport system permease protein
LLFCFVGPHIYVTQQVFTPLKDAYCTPSGAHLLGCDNLGYDVLGRLMVAGQNSLEVGLAAAFVACLFGALYGAASGFAGGVIDAFMMRIVDAMLSIPFILVIIVLAVLIHPNTVDLIFFIAVTYWPAPARLVRGETLTLRTREYVQAARVMGGSGMRAIVRHIAPNAMGTIVVNVTFQIANAILLLVALSWLGLGVPYPSVDWGDMLGTATQTIDNGYWWQILSPGVAIVVIVVALTMLGDGLRDGFARHE